MNRGFMFAILAALSFGMWQVFHVRASNLIHPVLGALLVSLIAVLASVPFLVISYRSSNEVSFTSTGMLFVVLAGICAFIVDYLVLKAYATSLPVSVGGPIIIGVSIAVTVVAGLFMGEAFSMLKSVGIVLILLGAAILASLETA